MQRWLAGALGLSCIIALITGIASGQDQAERMARLLRMDLAVKTSDMMGKALNLSRTEQEAFWPVYNDYRVELAQFNDQLQAVIKDYVQHYQSLDDAKAKDLIEKSFELQERRLNLLRKYVGNMEKVLPMKQVARFFQVESQMLRLMDVQINTQLPPLE
ncbi:MAG TPA: hypothetical protein VN203_10405 [Candidatus Acidoferrum sp.]|nr:hypothetical protein [Candidatus Acidoferrum sp.]